MKKKIGIITSAALCACLTLTGCSGLSGEKKRTVRLNGVCPDDKLRNSNRCDRGYQRG